MMELANWICTSKAIAKSKKSYAHFDPRTDFSICSQYILDPEKIAHHGFYPFIHYEMDCSKYKSKVGMKEKVRDICYAAHIDRCIYQAYSFILGELYNERVKSDGLDWVAVAYRSDLRTNNILLAKRAFEFISKNEQCYIMVGDFTKFFDKIDHGYLKDRWCDLMGVDRLPKDHYQVYKNITRYSRWELNDLLILNGLPITHEGGRALNKKKTVLSPKAFKQNKSMIHKNEDGYGIPQGSPISALLANVYMLKIDKWINDKVSRLGGMYMRYCDDFIVILPGVSDKISTSVFRPLSEKLNQTPGLELQPEKTQMFNYDKNLIKKCGVNISGTQDTNECLHFLGFSFDGIDVSIRAKTISKYYYRMYRKAHGIKNCHGYTPDGKKISKKNLYRSYSLRGAYCKKGNFLSYVNRSQEVFGNSPCIQKLLQRNMWKIAKALK